MRFTGQDVLNRRFQYLLYLALVLVRTTMKGQHCSKFFKSGNYSNQKDLGVASSFSFVSSNDIYFPDASKELFQIFRESLTKVFATE